MENEFIFENGELLDELGQALREVGTISVQGFGGLRIFCCGGVR